MKFFLKILSIAVYVFLLVGCPPASKSKKKMPPLLAINTVLDTGKEPSFIVTDDFDADSNLDLVVLNSGDHTFSYFKGNGDGSFQEPVLFKTGADPICLAVADFNGDGLPDLAELNYQDQNIQIFLNSGGGSFRNTGKILKPGKIPINLTTGDFNEDGIPDLVVSLRYHKVVTMFGKGLGLFGKPKEMPVKGQPTGVVVSDYNNDKHMDVAVALAGSGRTGIQILWGDGTGKFKGSKVHKGGKQPLTIANIDANGDGNFDLVTSSNSLHAITVVLNNGDGTLKSLRDFSAGEFPKFVAVGDFSGDGLQDLAVSNSTQDTLSVTLGRGDGTFIYPPVVHFVEEYPQGLAAGDFNKDGFMDIAISCRDKNLITVLLKNKFIPRMAVAPSEPTNS